MIKSKAKFGPDQFIVNYVLYGDGFKELDNRYNFVIPTADDKITIKDGIFYTKNGEKISVVHNAGNLSFWRLVHNFGYGAQFNKLKRKLYINIQMLYRSNENFYRTKRDFMESQEKIKYFVNNILIELKNKYNKMKNNMKEKQEKFDKVKY